MSAGASAVAAARGVGDLVLVYKRVTSLAGHTSRVAELLEQVQRLSMGNPDDTTSSLCAAPPASFISRPSAHLSQLMRALPRGGGRPVGSTPRGRLPARPAPARSGRPAGPRRRGGRLRPSRACALRADYRNVSSSNLIEDVEGLPEPKRHEGEVVRFQRVALNAPDGTRLVRELTFEVPRGRSCLIMGPNGAPRPPARCTRTSAVANCERFVDAVSLRSSICHVAVALSACPSTGAPGAACGWRMFGAHAHESVGRSACAGSGKSSLFRVLAGLWPLQARNLP